MDDKEIRARARKFARAPHYSRLLYQVDVARWGAHGYPVEGPLEPTPPFARLGLVISMMKMVGVSSHALRISFDEVLAQAREEGLSPEEIAHLTQMMEVSQ